MRLRSFPLSAFAPPDLDVATDAGGPRPMWLVLAQFGIEIEGDDSCVRVKNTRQSTATTANFQNPPSSIDSCGSNAMNGSHLLTAKQTVGQAVGKRVSGKKLTKRRLADHQVLPRQSAFAVFAIRNAREIGPASAVPTPPFARIGGQTPLQLIAPGCRKCASAYGSSSGRDV
jgi:hypothetical protein